MLEERINVRTLLSTVSSQLGVPRSRFKGFEDYAFSIAGLRLWNALLGSITDYKSIGALKKKVLRHICLNLLLIRCNLFSCIYIYMSYKAPENGLLDRALNKCFIIIYMSKCMQVPLTQLSE